MLSQLDSTNEFNQQNIENNQDDVISLNVLSVDHKFEADTSTIECQRALAANARYFSEREREKEKKRKKLSFFLLPLPLP